MHFFALSYDEPEALAAFAADFGITYPLLSDPASEVIRAFGILNTLVPEDDHPWFGMPFPGAYVTDADGRITAKFFENHLAIRPTVDQLIRAVDGVSPDDLGPPAAPPAQVEVEIETSLEPLRAGVQRDLVVTFHLPAGHHLYGEPVPEGMVATSVNFDEGIVSLAPTMPATTEHRLGTGEVLQVFEGDESGRFRIRAPYAISGGMADPDSAPTVWVSGTVQWQACDDDACGLPQRTPFSFDIEVGQMVSHRVRGPQGDEMDFERLFAQMSERRRDPEEF